MPLAFIGKRSEADLEGPAITVKVIGARATLALTCWGSRNRPHANFLTGCAVFTGVCWYGERWQTGRRMNA